QGLASILITDRCRAHGHPYRAGEVSRTTRERIEDAARSGPLLRSSYISDYLRPLLAYDCVIAIQKILNIPPGGCLRFFEWLFLVSAQNRLTSSRLYMNSLVSGAAPFERRRVGIRQTVHPVLMGHQIDRPADGQDRRGKQRAEKPEPGAHEHDQDEQWDLGQIRLFAHDQRDQDVSLQLLDDQEERQDPGNLI